MQEFQFVVKNPEGMCVRFAGILMKQIKKYDCATMIGKNGRSVKVTNLYRIIDLDMKCGDTITVKTDGAQEIVAAEELQAVMEKYL